MPTDRKIKGIVRRHGWRLLYLLCAATLVPSLFMHPHAEFAFAEVPAFHAALALAAGAAFVAAAQLARRWLMRAEDYYAEDD